jgi:hypothetical protein
MMKKYKALSSLTVGKPYHPLDVIRSYTTCFIDPNQLTTVAQCKEISSLYKKEYYFDSMLAKLFNVVTIGVLEENIPIRFSNDEKSLLLDTEVVRPFGGACIYDCEASKIVTVALNLNPKAAAGNNDLDLDALYGKIAHEFGNFAMAVAVNPAGNCEDNFLPYRTPEAKLAFLNATTHVLTSLLKEAKKVPASQSFGKVYIDFCKHSKAIEKAHYSLLEQALVEKSTSAFLSGLTKYAEYQGVERITCRPETEKYLYQQMAVRHFEQIPNGLQSDIGAKHEDLHHLQPLVQYTLTHLYPLFDQYVAERCEASTTYKCVMKEEELATITLLEPQVHVEL